MADVLHHIKVLPADLGKAVTIDIGDLSTLPMVMSEFGFALIANVYSPDDVAAAEKLFEEDLRSVVALSDEKFMKHPVSARAREKNSLAKAWPSDKAPLGRKQPLFASDCGIPHGKCAWAARTNGNVIRVFEKMYGTTDLCVGMDNVFFSNGNNQKKDENGLAIERMWPHADQSVHIQPSGSWNCYQSVLYLWPSVEGSSTTVVWPHSHKNVYPDLMKQQEFRGHFCKLDKSRFAEFADQAVRLTVPSGTMVLWDSKTIHQGWEGGPRLAIPICHEPRNRRSKEALASKIEACVRGLPTTHWASIGKFHSVGNAKAGGTEDFPIDTKAHLWLVDKENPKKVISTIEKWL